MHPVENHLREILSSILLHVEHALTRLLADSLSSANKKIDNLLNAVLEQLINQSIAAKLESQEFRRKIDDTVQ